MTINYIFHLVTFLLFLNMYENLNYLYILGFYIELELSNLNFCQTFLLSST